MSSIHCVCLITLVLASVLYAAPMAGILAPQGPSMMEDLASLEVRRYLYTRTDQLVEIDHAAIVPPDKKDLILIGRQDQPLIRKAAEEAGLSEAIDKLPPQGYLLKTVARDDHQWLFVVGGDDRGVLYGAYQLIEQFGVRFYLHGDVIPDETIELQLPEVEQTAAPIFETRGIQPFHDFPEGPDWWDVDDYKAVLAQLPKLRMNFIGLHTYPQGSVGPEPTVWIGLEENIGPEGKVQAGYPSRYFTTVSGTWGYRAKHTSDYSHGTGMLYQRDDYGADYMKGMTPWPETEEEYNTLFNDFGDVLRDAFEYAHRFGIQTCVGTETPLVIPDAVKARVQAANLDPADPATVQKLYAGIFKRISEAYPIDYYWFWTPEGWTWSGVSEEGVQATVEDLKSAMAAAEQVDVPFTLATCGWVLGPPGNRALFDEILPDTMPMSCINRLVGKEPVESGFAKIEARPKWAIPWLEDDPNMIGPQFWVGRMRRDAFDARRYGCTGLLGIHWRTRILGPNVSALARAAWDQSGWSEQAEEIISEPCREGHVGGKVADFPDNDIADTELDRVYQTVRWNLESYHLDVPPGRYKVILQLCEPHYNAPGKRIFDASVQGRRVIERIDLFDQVGRNKAFDVVAEDVTVEPDEPLVISFTPVVEFPLIAGIVVEGEGVSRRINCGGEAYQGYEADPAACPLPGRHLPALDFYSDWAGSQFGKQAGPEIAGIFADLDGSFPEVSTWVRGPGGLQPDPRPWEEVAATYDFVERMATFESRIEGAGEKARYHYWLNQFRYMRAVARARCIWGQFDQVMNRAEAQENQEQQQQIAREQALPLRRELIRQVTEVYRYLIPTITTHGAMGTLTNWEQHVQPMLLEQPGERLAAALGEPLPEDAQLPGDYSWPAHLLVPTVRTQIIAGEPLKVTAIFIDKARPRAMSLFFRTMGAGDYTEVPMQSIARGVYEATLAPDVAGDADLEYYVEATIDSGDPLYFPPTAPRRNQTVVVIPRRE